MTTTLSAGVTTALAYSRIFAFEPQFISASTVVYDIRGLAQYSIITDINTMVTVSRVDNITASLATTGSANAFTINSGTLQTTLVDWPYIMIQAPSGTCRFAGI